jgi:AraC-like DNA-binding protein
VTRNHSFPVSPGWRILLGDLGLVPANVLRRAGLPEDIFSRAKAALSTDEYFRLWQGIEAEAGDPALPLRVGEALSVEVFDPPIFAALCSPNLNVALERIATYKRLVCPMALHVDVGPKATNLELEWLDASAKPPASLVGVEIVFFVQLARIATRSRVCPLKVKSPQPLEPAGEYAEYFGAAVQRGPRPFIAFKSVDAVLPFLTANEEMWKSFEPHLRQRLFNLDGSATTAERVHAVLLELLPGGAASIDAVAQRLGTSSRTLQRRLNQESVSFQVVLSQTREDLAKHYLKTSDMTGAEISFLLGFEDPNSFFRAFHSWTGETLEQVRGAMQ